MSRILFGVIFFLLLSSCQTNKAEQNDTAELHMQIALGHIKNENYPLALKELLVAEDMSPANPVIHANLGFVYFMRERYELSEKHYKKALALKPDYADAKNNLARCYIEIGQFKQAESLLNDVVADLTYVDFSKAYANYGLLEFKRKNYPAAITYLKKSLERDRENCFTQVYLGRSYLEQKDLSLALTQLEKALPFCSEAGADEAHYYSAIALYRSNLKEKAKFRFEESMKLFPNGYNYEKAQRMLDLLNKGKL